jgi:hypothetical protein
MGAPSVTSYLMGGCANQLFQDVTGVALARRFVAEIGQCKAPGYRHNPAVADSIWEMERP